MLYSEMGSIMFLGDTYGKTKINHFCGDGDAADLSGGVVRDRRHEKTQSRI